MSIKHRQVKVILIVIQSKKNDLDKTTGQLKTGRFLEMILNNHLLESIQSLKDDMKSKSLEMIIPIVTILAVLLKWLEGRRI